MRFGPRWSIYKKVSGGQNFNQEKFQFLNHLTYDGKTTWLTFNYVFFVDFDSRSKVKFHGQTGNQVNLRSYLKTYLTHRLHTWYQDTTQ